VCIPIGFGSALSDVGLLMRRTRRRRLLLPLLRNPFRVFLVARNMHVIVAKAEPPLLAGDPLLTYYADCLHASQDGAAVGVTSRHRCRPDEILLDE
jgi:hypothetical protein